MFIRDGCFQNRYLELARACTHPCQAETQSTNADLSEKSVPQATGLPPFTYCGCKSLGYLQSCYYGAVLAPDTIRRKKYNRLQFAVELAGCSNHCLPLVKMQDTFCSEKEQSCRQVYPRLSHLENELVLTSDHIFGRQMCTWGQKLWDVLCYPDLLFAFLVCPLQ